MILKEIIELTSTNLDIFVNESSLNSKITPDILIYTPFLMFENEKYFVIQNKNFYPDGLEFEPEYDDLEVVEINSNIMNNISKINVFIA